MEVGKPQSWPRRILVVDKKWQTAVASRVILAAMVAVMFVQLVGIHFLTSEEALEMTSTGWSLAAVLISGTQMIVLVAALWRTTIRITHAVAGPAYVIEKAIDNLREGKFDSRLTLRDGDYLKSLAAAVKRLTVHLEEQQRNGARPAPAEAAAADESETATVGTR